MVKRIVMAVAVVGTTWLAAAVPASADVGTGDVTAEVPVEVPVSADAPISISCTAVAVLESASAC